MHADEAFGTWLFHLADDKHRRDLVDAVGRRSEQLSPDQLNLAMEDIEQEIAEKAAADDAAEQS
jgi:hypothetical protein